MKYLTGTTRHSLPDIFGFLVTPRKGVTTLSEDPTKHRLWAVDNGAFSGKFNEESFFSFLKKMRPFLDTNLFCACPDMMKNPFETLILYDKYSTQIRELGYEVAFICQDGQENLSFPNDFDWLFVGGSTEWKLSQGAIDCILRAKDLGKKIHVGRVNSFKRWKHFAQYGIDTVDGNHIKFEPDKAVERIIKWYEKLVLLGLENS